MYGIGNPLTLQGIFIWIKCIQNVRPLCHTDFVPNATCPSSDLNWKAHQERGYGGCWRTGPAWFPAFIPRSQTPASGGTKRSTKKPELTLWGQDRKSCPKELLQWMDRKMKTAPMTSSDCQGQNSLGRGKLCIFQVVKKPRLCLNYIYVW